MPGEPPLAAEELAKLRGGFQLPGGIAVTIGVTTATQLNGQEILRSTFNISDGSPVVRVIAADPSSGRSSEVQATVNGGGVQTRDGSVQLRSTPGGLRVDLAGDAINVSHLIGNALGTVVANSGNDRSIDVTTSVNIGLSGIRPEAVGSSAIRAENLALDATTRLVR